MALAFLLSWLTAFTIFVTTNANQPQVVEVQQPVFEQQLFSNWTSSFAKRNIYLQELEGSRFCGFQQGNLRFPLQCTADQYCNPQGELFECCDKVATKESAWVTTNAQTWSYKTSDGDSTFYTTETSTYSLPVTSTASYLSYAGCTAAYSTCYDSTKASGKSDGLLCTNPAYPKCATYLYATDMYANVTTDGYSAKMFFCATQRFIMPILSQGKSEISTTSNSDYEGIRTTIGNDDQNPLAGPTSSFSMTQASRTPAAIVTAPTSSATASASANDAVEVVSVSVQLLISSLALVLVVLNT